MSGARALFLTPEVPYPIASGGALRTACVLGFLAKHFSVDVIVFRGANISQPIKFPEGLVDRVSEVVLDNENRNMAGRLLRTASRLYRRSPPHIDRYADYENAVISGAQGTYDVAVIEHFHCATYVEVLKRFSRKVVCDLHNIESAWHNSNAKSAKYIQSIIQSRFSKDAAALEKELLPIFDLLLVTSKEDKARCNVKVPIHVVPNTIPQIDLPVQVEEEVIAFSGTLDYEPNRLAIEWFANSVWPSLSTRFPTLRWRIIGRNPEAVQHLISDVPRVELTGPVPDAVAELASARAVIVPLLTGSGTRLKIIEAWAAGRAVISTPIGAEGLPIEPGVNILLAEADPSKFADAVSQLLLSDQYRQQVGTAGRRTYEQGLTWQTAWVDLENAFSAIGLCNSSKVAI